VAVAVPVAVPLYTASYGADGSAALLAELQKLRAEVAGLRSPAPAKASTPTVGALATRCASCHSGEKSRGGVKLFAPDGARAQLSPENLGDAIQAVLDGRMPPNAKLPDGDRLAVLKELTAATAAK
jgi:cytochrome c553